RPRVRWEEPGGARPTVQHGPRARAAAAPDRRRRAHGAALRGPRGTARASPPRPARALVHALEGPPRRPRGGEGLDRRPLGRPPFLPARLEEGARHRAWHRRRRVLLYGGSGRRSAARARARPLLA